MNGIQRKREKERAAFGSGFGWVGWMWFVKSHLFSFYLQSHLHRLCRKRLVEAGWFGFWFYQKKISLSFLFSSFLILILIFFFFFSFFSKKPNPICNIHPSILFWCYPQTAGKGLFLFLFFFSLFHEFSLYALHI